MERLPDFLRRNASWLAAGALLSFLSSFGQTFSISVFAGEIRGECGLTHGGWGAIYSLATMASAAVVTGALIDRGLNFPGQALGIAAYFVLASSVAGLGAARAGRLLPRVPAPA